MMAHPQSPIVRDRPEEMWLRTLKVVLVLCVVVVTTVWFIFIPSF